jgi:hypothetical protein
MAAPEALKRFVAPELEKKLAYPTRIPLIVPRLRIARVASLTEHSQAVMPVPRWETVAFYPRERRRRSSLTTRGGVCRGPILCEEEPDLFALLAESQRVRGQAHIEPARSWTKGGDNKRNAGRKSFIN